MAGPEIKTIREHQFTAKKPKQTQHAHTYTPRQNPPNQGKLCCVTERTAEYTLGLPRHPQSDTGTYRGHVDVVWVARAVVSTGSSFGSLRFSCHTTRNDRFGDTQRAFTVKQTPRIPDRQTALMATTTTATEHYLFESPQGCQAQRDTDPRFSLETSPGTCLMAHREMLRAALPEYGQHPFRRQSPNLPRRENTRQDKSQHELRAAQGIHLLEAAI